MSWLREKFRSNTVLFLALSVLALWVIYQVLAEAAPVLFLRLDASYGRLGGSFGYALLGLGLGAAAGAIAAQRRYRLNKLILAGAIGLALLLVSLTQLGSLGSNSYVATEVQRSETPIEGITTEATEEETVTEAVAPVLPDTSSIATEGWQQVIVRVAPLRSYWADSLQAPVAYLHEGDTVHLLRRAHRWLRVAGNAGNPAVGWVRQAGLGPLPEEAPAPESAPEPAGIAAHLEKTTPAAAAAIAESPAPVADPPPTTVEHPTWPTGHHQYTGYVGELSATYSLDWHPNGAVSGSYYYDKHPRTTYRLIGSGKPNGELHLLEFTRGQQTARCVLQQQNEGYAGIMSNTDGQEFKMALE